MYLVEYNNHFKSTGTYFGIPLRFIGLGMKTGGGPKFKADFGPESIVIYIPDIFIFGLLFGYLCFNSSEGKDPLKPFDNYAIVGYVPEKYEHLLNF